MNFLQRLTSKSAAPTDAYGSVSTLEENDTSSPHADSLQDADNFKFDTNTTAAVIIKDKLKDSPFLSDLSAGAPPSSPSKIKSSSSTGNVFSSWSAAGNALATIVKKDTASTSNDAEPEAEGKLMEEININWNYVSPAEPRASNDKDVVSGEERLKQTRKVLEEEKQGQFATHLHAAVISQDLNALKQLNHKGADLSAKNSRGQCVLHVASSYGYPHMVKSLLQFKANADCRDEDGQTPLHMAASGRLDGDLEGRLACIALLLSCKANLELPDKVGRAPLHVAAQTGNLESVIRLLDAGAGRAPRDRNGMRPVDLASMAGYTHIVDYLTSIDTAAQVGKLQQYSKYL
ncbi:hypothetical protein ABBQ38_013595 [Trebouxia sp. C0009 RCD-2024]